jgi:hypothetical protein
MIVPKSFPDLLFIYYFDINNFIMYVHTYVKFFFQMAIPCLIIDIGVSTQKEGESIEEKNLYNVTNIKKKLS